MQANLFTVREIFEGRLLRVPDYQRGYSWEELQLRDFLEDLELLRPEQFHYTGTIVLHPANVPPELDDEGRQHTTFDIVDGQQRLTTIVILLCELRRELIRLGSEPQLQEGIRRGFLWVHRQGTKGRLPKLALSAELGEFFERRMLLDPPSADAPRTQSEARIDEARTRFATYLTEQSRVRNDYPAWLCELQTKLTSQLRTSLFPVENTTEVGIVFEVLNNRGKPLSELEKVKNYLLYVAAKIDPNGQLAKSTNATWARVLRDLMLAGLTRSQDEDLLLRTQWLLAYDPNDRQWDGSRSIKSAFDLRAKIQQAELYAKVDSFLEILAKVASAFTDIERPERDDAFAGMTSDHEQRRRLALWVERLHRLGFVAPFRPVLAAARMVAPHDASAFLQLVQACERFSFIVYRIAGCRPNAGRAWLFRLAHEVAQAKTPVTKVADRITNAVGLYCKKAVYDRFFELDVKAPTSFYEWGGLRYLLYEWETHLAGNKQVHLSWRQLHEKQPKTTIEHVLPQNPDNSFWLTRFDDDARRIYTHDIGNLCLTEDNSAYGRKAFGEKRGQAGLPEACYAMSNLFSERALAAATDWNPEAIVARRATIVAWAKERWPWSGAEDGDVETVAAEAETGDEP